MGDRIEIPLDLEGFDVIASCVVDGWLEVDVESTRTPECVHCGSLDVVGHGRNQRRIRDRSVGRPCVLLWRQRRLRCSDCHRTSRERHPEVAGPRSITKRFRYQLYEQAVHGVFSDIAATEGVTIYRVVEAFDSHSVHELAEPIDHVPEVICIDEHSVKGKHYQSMLFDPHGGGAFDSADGRDEGSATELFGRLSPQVRGAIKVVVMDMHWPYRRAAEKWLPDAAVVADRYHVHRAISKAANQVRRRCGRRPNLGRDRRKHPRFHRIVLDTKLSFMKRAHRLTSEERDRLDVLFEAFPEMGVAWLLRESFLAVMDSPDRAEAERRLKLWFWHLDVANIPEMTRMWILLKKWQEPILAYVESPYTNGFAEGLTNRIKVLKRIAYGFRNTERYRRKVLLACGRRRPGRPQPPSFA
jgi:transposase